MNRILEEIEEMYVELKEPFVRNYNQKKDKRSINKNFRDE
jgi:hypothetical protein